MIELFCEYLMESDKSENTIKPYRRNVSLFFKWSLKEPALLGCEIFYFTYNYVSFIIDESLTMFYYRGLSEWNCEKGYLRDPCLTAQDRFKQYLDYFQIPYNE